MQQYGDLDALMELYGNLCADNPSLEVFHRLASEAVYSDDLSKSCDSAWRHRLEQSHSPYPERHQPGTDTRIAVEELKD
jgi:hypothetical protein